MCPKRLRLSWKADECKPLARGQLRTAACYLLVVDKLVGAAAGAEAAGGAPAAVAVSIMHSAPCTTSRLSFHVFNNDIS